MKFNVVFLVKFLKKPRKNVSVATAREAGRIEHYPRLNRDMSPARAKGHRYKVVTLYREQDDTK